MLDTAIAQRVIPYTKVNIAHDGHTCLSSHVPRAICNTKSYDGWKWKHATGTQKEYEKVKMGYQRLRHVSLKLQVDFGNIVALSTLKKAYPWPWIVPVCHCFASFEPGTFLNRLHGSDVWYEKMIQGNSNLRHYFLTQTPSFLWERCLSFHLEMSQSMVFNCSSSPRFCQFWRCTLIH